MPAKAHAGITQKQAKVNYVREMERLLLGSKGQCLVLMLRRRCTELFSACRSGLGQHTRARQTAPPMRAHKTRLHFFRLKHVRVRARRQAKPLRRARASTHAHRHTRTQHTRTHTRAHAHVLAGAALAD